MTQITIPDVSRWQGTIDWDAFSAAIDGCIIKVGGADGGLYVDGQFTRNRDESRRTGKPRWFYWYKGSAGTPQEQAQYFINSIGGLQAGEAVMLDDENEGSVNAEFDAAFNDEIVSLIGATQVVYSNQARFVGDLSALSSRNIGAISAKYGANDGTVAGAGSAASAGGLTVVGWQYTSAAHIAGITANSVDLSLFYGDQGQFEAYGVNSGSVNSTPAPTPAPSVPVATGNGTYTVIKGDTLSGIGAKLGISWLTIAQTNGITSPYTIFPGQVLNVFGGTPGQSVAAAAHVSGQTYTVVSGDTLSGIGAKTGHDWQTIASLNGIGSPYTIYPGQVLQLDQATSQAAASVATYTVVSGDTLSGIGAKTGVAWPTIASVNGIGAPFTIYPGQVLKLS